MSDTQAEGDLEASAAPTSPQPTEVPERPFLVSLVTHRAWSAIFLWVIMANTVTMAMMRPTEPHNSKWNARLELIETGFLVVFTIELALKLIALRAEFFADGWNKLDFVIVLSGYMVFIPGETINTSVFRTVRVLRPLRSIGMMPGVRILIDALIMSLPGLSTLLVRPIRGRWLSV